MVSMSLAPAQTLLTGMCTCGRSQLLCCGAAPDLFGCGAGTWPTLAKLTHLKLLSPLTDFYVILLCWDTYLKIIIYNTYFETHSFKTSAVF
jgi:hypothetical protein